MKRLWHLAHQGMTWMGMIKIISAYELKRYQISGMDASMYGGKGILVCKPENKVAFTRLETHIILFPWINSRLDYEAMETKMRFDLIAEGYDQVVIYQERYIGEHQTTKF